MAAKNNSPKALLYFFLGIILVWLGPGFSEDIELTGIALGLCYIALTIVFVVSPEEKRAKFLVMGIAVVGIFASISFVGTALVRDAINPVTVVLRLSLAIPFILEAKSTFSK